ncbi:MAG: hypothetical protein M1817_004731 [Caeruleum heppii]|nr:MAG: hypothetical protein M1817_004731 [Caeruleum heppii]
MASSHAEGHAGRSATISEDEQPRPLSPSDSNVVGVSRGACVNSYGILVDHQDSPTGNQLTGAHQQRCIDPRGLCTGSSSRALNEISPKSTGKHAAPQLSSEVKRRKKNSLLPEFKVSALGMHISIEESRCDDFAITCFRPTLRFLHPASGSSGLFKYATELETFFFGLGSSESVVLLQEILKSHRQTSHMSSRTRLDLSKLERVDEIARLEGKIMNLGLLKRCHVHRLWLDCGGSQRPANDGFVVETSKALEKKRMLTSGNPFHKADSDLTISMMRDVYPDSKEGDADYDRKYRLISRLRGLGQRLDCLVARFGFGILGLIPMASKASDLEATLVIDDDM